MEQRALQHTDGSLYVQILMHLFEIPACPSFQKLHLRIILENVPDRTSANEVLPPDAIGSITRTSAPDPLADFPSKIGSDHFIRINGEHPFPGGQIQGGVLLVGKIIER